VGCSASQLSTTRFSRKIWQLMRREPADLRYRGAQEVSELLQKSICRKTFAERQLKKSICRTTFAEEHLQKNICRRTFAEKHLQKNICRTTVEEEHLQNDICRRTFAEEHVNRRLSYCNRGEASTRQFLNLGAKAMNVWIQAAGNPKRVPDGFWSTP